MNNSGNNGRLGWRKPEGVREQHQVRAYPDEWEMIRDFAKIIKKGDKQAAQEFLNQHRI